jgi:hypothetical protein
LRFGRHWIALILIAAVLLVLRLPSFAEPAWFPDEGTYIDIGYALNHGAHLYVNVWDNKPPGVYWVGRVMAMLSSPQVWFAAVAFLCAALSCLAVYGITTRVRGRGWGTVAAVGMAVLASLPTLDGDLFNSEPAGAAAAAVAMWLIFVRPRREVLSLLVAGALAGVAFLFKAVFALDGLALLGAIWLIRADCSGAQRRRQILVLLIGGVVVLAAAATALFATGSLGGALHVLLVSDSGYVSSANGASAAIGVARDALVLVVTGFLVFRWRRTHPTMAALVLWLGLDVCASLISPRGFSHYIQQVEPALCIVTALLAAWLWTSTPRRTLAIVALALQPVICLLLLWVPRAQSALASGSQLPYFEAGNFVTRQLGTYYANGYGALFGNPTSRKNFDALMPIDLNKQNAAVQWFSQHSRPGERVFVWGSIHWAYVLSQRVPAGRYVTLNSAYYLEPGSQDLLVADLWAHPPAVLIADAPLPGDVQNMLHGGHYVDHVGAVAGDDVWVRPGEP